MGDENGAELLLDGRRMNDFNWSVFTLPCRIQDYKIIYSGDHIGVNT